MEFGGGFASTMLRPVDAGGYQRDGAGVHHMNDATKTPSQSFPPTSNAKSRRKLLEVIKHRPEQPFSQRRVAALIGVGKIIAARRSRPAQARKRPAVEPQRVTDVVKTDGVGQLPKEHADHVTPGTEGSRHKIHAGFPRKFRNQMRRNEIAKAVAEH